MRKRLGIGEIVATPKDGWGYWFVAAHGPDIWNGARYMSAETLEHYPTGILYHATATKIRQQDGFQPDLNLQKKYPRLYSSVACHINWIRGRYDSQKTHKGYLGLPCQKEWDIHSGGSRLCAIWEILQDIGDRPSSSHHLCMIEHAKGFVRGNLKWELGSLNWVESKIRKAKNEGASIIDVLKVVNEVYA